MREKFVGIIGGMGPDATVAMFQNILRATTHAQSDQDHLRILIYNNPKIPDRTEAICNGGTDPRPELIDSAMFLQQAGVELIIMPCVTAHNFYDDIQAAVTIPILHIIKETLRFASIQFPESSTLSLLSTMGTLRSGLFQRFCEEWGFSILTSPKEIFQQYVMKAIYYIKSGTEQGKPTQELHHKDTYTKMLRKRKVELSDPKRMLQYAALRLVEDGAQAIIAGCTEIPLALTPDDVPVPFLDPLKILAQAVVRAAVGEDALLARNYTFAMSPQPHIGRKGFPKKVFDRRNWAAA